MRSAILLFALGASAFGQYDGIYASASRTVALNPDEVTFNVGVIGGLGLTLDAAVALVQEAGVSSGHLVYVVSTPDARFPSPTRTPQLVYAFLVTQPWARLKETAEMLSKAGAAAAASGVEIQFNLIASPGAAAIAEARRRAWSDLIPELRQKAEATANASNMTLGPLLTVGDALVSGSGGASPSSAAFVLSPGVYTPIRISFGLTARFAAQPK